MALRLLIFSLQAHLTSFSAPLACEIGNAKYLGECLTFWISLCGSFAVLVSCLCTIEVQSRALMDSSCFTSEAPYSTKGMLNLIPELV